MDRVSSNVLMVLSLVLLVSLGFSEAFRIQRSVDSDLEDLMRLREVEGCRSGPKHWRTGQTQSEGSTTCTCRGNNQWTCEQFKPEETCRLGPKRFREGETHTEGTLTCTCTEGAWKCPGYDELPKDCYMGSRRFKHGESYTEGGVTCRCNDSKWDCP